MPNVALALVGIILKLDHRAEANVSTTECTHAIRVTDVRTQNTVDQMKEEQYRS